MHQLSMLLDVCPLWKRVSEVGGLTEKEIKARDGQRVVRRIFIQSSVVTSCRYSTRDNFGVCHKIRDAASVFL